MKLLIFTNVFPDEATPNTGFYVKEQVARLKSSFDVRVIKAVPVRPFGSRGKRRRSVWDGIDVYTVPYTVLPKVGVLFSGRSYLGAVGPLVADIRKEFGFDAIVAYWTYPEGYAAGELAKKYGVPLLLRPRGSDINLFLGNALLSPLVRKSLTAADKVIPVTEDMARKVIGLGVAADKVDFIHNGLNAEEFYPMDREECRRELGILPEEKAVLFIGNFLDVKGVPTLLEAAGILDAGAEPCSAVTKTPVTKSPVKTETESLKTSHSRISLYFLGNGPLKSSIEHTAKTLGCVTIRIIGDVPHGELARWMNAADLLCLPSNSEGCPNVVLEALACGLPVAAARVGGVPELLDSPELGILFPAGDARAAAEAVREALGRPWNREALTARVAGQSWDGVAERLIKEIDKLVARCPLPVASCNPEKT